MLPTEDLARFIFQSGHFSLTEVKYAAFMPWPNPKASVSRVSGLSEREVWKLGEDHVASSARPSIKARGSIRVQEVLDVRLQVEPDPKPHYRHANIAGWDPERSKQKLQAIELAKRARLHLNPGGRSDEGRSL